MAKTSKNITLSTSFMQAAQSNPEGSLAYMIMAAFGVTLAQCVAVVDRMVKAKDQKMMIFCIAAGVQVRGNTVYVGAQYADVRSKYPELVIEGSRDVKDTFNYGACHVCGHILAHITTDGLGANILKKAGSCVNGTFPSETEAGKINAEIAKGFIREDVVAFDFYDNNLTDVEQKFIDGVFVAVPKLSASFNNSMKPAVPKPVGKPSKAAAEPVAEDEEAPKAAVDPKAAKPT